MMIKWRDAFVERAVLCTPIRFTKSGAHGVTRPTYAGRCALSARRKYSTSAGSLSEYFAPVGCDCSLTKMPIPRCSSARNASSSVRSSPMKNRTNVPALQAQRFQQPEHGLAFVPSDGRQQFEDFFTLHPAEPAMSRRHFANRLFHLGHVVFLYVAVVRCDGKAFPLHTCTRNSTEDCVQLFFCHVQVGQKLRGHLPAQSVWPGDIKSVAAGVHNGIDVHASANVIELATAKNGNDRCSSGK